MKSFYISLALFFVMIISIIFSINYLNKICKQLEQIDISMEQDVNNESWDTAYTSSIDFMNKWKKYSENISVFVDHKEIDNIHNELWRLTQYIKCENKDETLASLHVIKFFLNHIMDMEKMNIQNIF